VVSVSTPAVPAAPGARVSLALDVSPKRTMHVYAPGQKTYIPISLTLENDAAFKAGAARFPAPERVVDALDEPQLVYSKPIRIAQDITLSADRARLPGTVMTVKGTLRYQACDDSICYAPINVPVAWTISLKPPAR
jgi:DsbC/DsbD-like thiol-disulfide interchange protein